MVGFRAFSFSGAQWAGHNVQLHAEHGLSLSSQQDMFRSLDLEKWQIFPYHLRSRQHSTRRSSQSAWLNALPASPWLLNAFITPYDYIWFMSCFTKNELPDVKFVSLDGSYIDDVSNETSEAPVVVQSPFS